LGGQAKTLEAVKQDAQDSQQSLVASIVRVIQSGLPVPDSEVDVMASVRSALHAEARGSELTFAYVRVAFLSVLTLLNLLALAVGWPIPAADPWISTFVSITWLALATILMIALRRGWYRRWLRRAVPWADGLLIGSSFILLRYSLSPSWETWEAGVVGGAAAACLLVAFSGALRLSRSGALFSTSAALVTWLTIALVDDAGPVTLAFIAATILAVGALSSRFTRVVRRVVTNEVARGRITRMYDDAKREVSAREEVLQIVSHDLRNPLNTIAMATDLMLDLKPNEEERIRRLGVIKRAGEHMSRMIQDLLDVARMEAGNLVIEPKAISVGRIATDVLDLMRPLAADRSLSLTAVYDPALPAVRADRERIIQVFSNLIGNAIKFTPAGGHIVIKAEPVGDKVRFAVIDSGPGIPEEKQSRIFDRFWQARKTDRRGIGLGLTIARYIVEAHGERIDVISKLGEGTEFWFELPIA
jgi:signal transduction histidine kinase